MKTRFWSALIFLSGVILAGLILPPIWNLDPMAPSYSVLTPPSAGHPLGTTDLGEDVLAQLIHGALPTLGIGLAAGLGTVFLSFILGAVGAVAGGFTDRLILRMTDILMALPSLVAMMMIAAMVRPGIMTLVLMLILLEWPGDVRVFRAKVLEEMARESVESARVFGGSWFYVVRRHLFLDTSPLLIVRFLQTGRKAIFKLVGLSFLGLTDPHMVSWGGMLHHATPYLSLDAWKWWALPPAISLCLVLISLYFIGAYMERKIFVH